MDAADDEESHGKLVPVSEEAEFQFHLVFSNKTQTDAYCLEVWGKLTAQGVQVWQQQKNIPKDSDNWCAPPLLPPRLGELGMRLTMRGVAGSTSGTRARPRASRSSASSRPPTSSPPTA